MSALPITTYRTAGSYAPIRLIRITSKSPEHENPPQRGRVATVLFTTFCIATATLYLVKQSMQKMISDEQFERLSSIGDAIDQKFAVQRLDAHPDHQRADVPALLA